MRRYREIPVRALLIAAAAAVMGLVPGADAANRPLSTVVFEEEGPIEVAGLGYRIYPDIIEGEEYLIELTHSRTRRACVWRIGETVYGTTATSRRWVDMKVTFMARRTDSIHFTTEPLNGGRRCSPYRLKEIKITLQ